MLLLVVLFSFSLSGCQVKEGWGWGGSDKLSRFHPEHFYRSSGRRGEQLLLVSRASFLPAAPDKMLRQIFSLLAAQSWSEDSLGGGGGQQPGHVSRPDKSETLGWCSRPAEAADGSRTSSGATRSELSPPCRLSGRRKPRWTVSALVLLLFLFFFFLFLVRRITSEPCQSKLFSTHADF